LDLEKGTKTERIEKKDRDSAEEEEWAEKIFPANKKNMKGRRELKKIRKEKVCFLLRLHLMIPHRSSLLSKIHPRINGGTFTISTKHSSYGRGDLSI
jgi:hypothetical protein